MHAGFRADVWATGGPNLVRDVPQGEHLVLASILHACSCALCRLNRECLLLGSGDHRLREPIQGISCPEPFRENASQSFVASQSIFQKQLRQIAEAIAFERTDFKPSFPYPPTLTLERAGLSWKIIWYCDRICTLR
ncbi:hypothetical protein [Azospirillum largimobile]